MGSKVKILFFDIETAPILGYVWGLWKNNVGLNQIHKDWHLLSWAAKWADEPALLYMDQRDEPEIEDDKKILSKIWDLLDAADVVVTQNGRAFDAKKLNARFIIQGFQPPSSYKHFDTKLIAKRNFSFTSNKLEYMADKLNMKYKKLEHEKFPGFKLWDECLKRNPAAWDELEKYNCHDVLALEELWEKLRPWDSSFNPNLYDENETSNTCACGSTMWFKWGFAYTNAGKFQRFRCKNCGAQMRSRQNEFTEMKRLTLKAKITG